MAKSVKGINDFETWCKNNNREDLLSEWNYSKNQILPSELGAFSAKKVWWIKPYDTDDGRHFEFEWEASVGSRVNMNSGCPFLSGKAVYKGFNDLETDNPKLAKEFHPTKNGLLHPYEISKSSPKKIWWRCEKGHEWEASVYERNNNNIGCQICAGKKLLKGFNDLRTVNPELAKEFHPTKNGELTSSDIIYKSAKKVWWLLPYDTEDGKHFDFEWEAPVYDRCVEKSGCPYFRNIKIMPGYNDFKTWCIDNKLENILKFWDYDKNDVTPSEIPSSSKIKYFWKCEKGHSWNATTDQVKRSKGCTICSGRVVESGDNDFETLYPLIAKDWDYEKNRKNPNEYRPGSSARVWWKCKEGHIVQNTIYTRIKSGGCPYCNDSKVYAGYNDFKTLYPDLALQWDVELNGGLCPNNLATKIKKKVWWKCNNGHSWQTTVDIRTKGNNCPYCSKKGTSLPEQTVFYYLSKNIESIRRDKSLGVELDIYLPNLSAAIEYDGSYFHSSKKSLKKDLKKNNICEKHGIKLFRIREEGCPQMEESTYLSIYSYKYKDEEAFENIIKSICKELNLECDVDLSRDRGKILEFYYDSEVDNSIGEFYPEIAKEWDYEKNGKLEPNHISYGSNKKVWWKGKCGHSYQKSPAERIRAGCPYCAKTRLNIGVNDFASNCSELLKEWDYEKNGKLRPDKISQKASKTVWWKGACGHSWKASVASRVDGSGCPYCSGRFAIQGVNDIETTNPEILSEWDYDKNNKQPSMYKNGSGVSVWWKCSKCGYEYKKTIKQQIDNKYPCPNCYPSKIKRIMNIETGEIFNSLVEAAKKYNCSKSGICNCCKGNSKTSAGYHWKYMD